MADQQAPVAPAHRVRVEREATTMGLYVSITLLGTLTVTDPSRIVEVIWGTTVGLALAHWFAFSLAARLIDPDADQSDVRAHLIAQLVGASVVAAVATIAVVIAPESAEPTAARFATAAFVGVVVFLKYRAFGHSHLHAGRGALVAMALALAVAGVKHALGH